VRAWLQAALGGALGLAGVAAILAGADRDLAGLAVVGLVLLVAGALLTAASLR
jgi:hypothetical protein